MGRALRRAGRESRLTVRRYLDAEVKPLTDGWRVTVNQNGDGSNYGSPVPPEGEYLPAQVPGTLAGALTATGRFDPAHPQPLQDRDAWYVCELTEPAGPAVLRFEGLATVAEVFLNDAPILTVESMFEANDVAVELTGTDRLAIRFAALTDRLTAKGPRARWRPRLADSQGLRLVRTTLLGHMPGWCPSIQAVGPYRPVSLIRPGRLSLDDVRIGADVDGTDGVLSVSFAGTLSGLRLRCGDVEADLVPGDGRTEATLRVPDATLWWPATHGRPGRYDVEVVDDHGSYPLVRTGFRHLEVDRGDGSDFAVRVNGVPVFCRGAVWTSADMLTLAGTRDGYKPLLRRAADAGMNMIRTSGITTYESTAFFDLCDELGLLVFADFMFANFDYPAGDPAFVAHVETEARQFLDARQGSPSLAVACGGSEIAQQAAMLGLPGAYWYSALVTDTLPTLVAELRPDVAWVPGSPSGGDLPFSVDAGIGHYYGVGAYERPLTDARRADVVFASECLAFAHLPDDGAMPADLRLGVPRDPGADWDFADTRDHYLRRLYGLDPADLRANDPSAYLAYSRATTAEVVAETFAEWRRAGSRCRGALVFALSDVAPGAGWGVIDHAHRPKSTFRSLARAFAPVAIGITDEGVNGLHLHLTNETDAAVAGQVEVFALRDGTVKTCPASRPVVLAARQQLMVPATDLLGSFFDYSYAYRFGPPEHQVVVARLRVDGEVVAEAYSFPLGRPAALFPATLAAGVGSDPSGWFVDLTADVFAQSVHLHAPGYLPADDWFHLTPDRPRRIRLVPMPRTVPAARPTGTVRSLGGGSVRLS
jgi:beta-mannosidase